MTNSILSIFFLLLSFSCISESCYIPKEKLKIYQQKHGSKIVINKRNNTSGNIFFEIVLPEKIDNLQYSGSSLIKKNHESGNEEFIIPLRSFIDGDIVTVSYEASPKVSQGMYINASYGNSCSVSIEHEIM